MPEKDYSHRSVEEKLGIKPGCAVLVADGAGLVSNALRAGIEAAAGRSGAEDDEPLDVAVVSVQAGDDFVEVLERWRGRLEPAGGVWLLTPKRKQPGYVDQNELIAAGPAAGLVDNKVCSVSETVSAMRFVIPKAARPGRR